MTKLRQGGNEVVGGIGAVQRDQTMRDTLSYTEVCLNDILNTAGIHVYI